jgi:hypothetical protein
MLLGSSPHSLKKNNFLKRNIYLELKKSACLTLVRHYDQNFFKKKMMPKQVLNLRASAWKLNTLPTILSWPRFLRSNFVVLIWSCYTYDVSTLVMGAMLFVRSPITELE